MASILAPATAGTAMRGIRRAGWLSLITLAVIFAGCSKTSTPEPAHPDGPANVRSSRDVVKVAAAAVSLPGGGSADATVALSISPGFHINANPATFAYLIATQVTPGKVAGITAGKPVYPTAGKQKFDFAEEPLAVYEGRVEIKLPLQAEAKAKGTISVPLDVRIQACDHKECFPPDTLKTTIAVEVK